MSKTRQGITRRQAIAGAGALSLGVITLRSSEAEAAVKWDHETDILVVGSGVGAATAGGGVALNLASYSAGLPKVGDILPERAAYQAKVTQNRAGLGIAIAGGATAAAGAIITIIGASMPDGKVAAVPWFVANPEAVAFGISGRLP